MSNYIKTYSTFLKCITFCFLVFGYYSCSKTPNSTKEVIKNNNYSISISTKQNTFKKVFLCEIVKNTLQIIDTASLHQGKCDFLGTVTFPKRMALYFDDSYLHHPFIFLVANEKININIDKDNPENGIVLNSPINNVYKEYQRKSSLILKEITPLYYELQQARLKNDVVKLKSINNQIISVGNKFLNYSLQFINDNPKSYATVFILEDLLKTHQIDSLTFRKKHQFLLRKLPKF